MTPEETEVRKELAQQQTKVLDLNEVMKLNTSLVKAIRTRLAYGHAGSCILIVGQGRDPCSCGHTDLANALSEFVRYTEL
jgi:hypothetical protein